MMLWMKVATTSVKKAWDIFWNNYLIQFRAHVLRKGTCVLCCVYLDLSSRSKQNADQCRYGRSASDTCYITRAGNHLLSSCFWYKSLFNWYKTFSFPPCLGTRVSAHELPFIRFLYCTCAGYIMIRDSWPFTIAVPYLAVTITPRCFFIKNIEIFCTQVRAIWLFGSEEMLLHRPLVSTILLHHCPKKVILHELQRHIYFIMWHNDGIWLKTLFLCKFNETVCLRTTPEVSLMILWTYAFSFTILVRWRPKSISIYIARHAINIITYCTPRYHVSTNDRWGNTPVI